MEDFNITSQKSQTAYYPFANQNERFTIMDNFLFDHIMPTIKPNSWKILCLIVRKTNGWHKEDDQLSYSQIRDGTGIASQSTVQAGLKELTETNLIIQTSGDTRWEAFTYSLNRSYSIMIPDEQKQAATIPPDTKTVTDTSTEIVTDTSTVSVNTKETINKEKKEDFAFAISALSLAEIKETKLPLKDWKQWLEDERTERNRPSVISFLEKKITLGLLLPDTEASRLLFAKIASEAEAKGRRPPTKFPTLECKSRFDQAAGRLNGTLERAIDNGLAAGITSIPKLTAYISSPKWQQGDNKNGSGRTDQSKQSFNSKTGASTEYRPKVGNGQSPALRARLEAAFSRND